MRIQTLLLTAAVATPAFADGHGAALYGEYCAACHGAALEGQPDWREPGPDGTYPAPPHDESGHTWHHGDGLLFDYVKRGGAVVLAEAGVSNYASGMPGFGDALRDEDITAILDYIRSTWSPRVRALQETRTEAEALYGN